MRPRATPSATACGRSPSDPTSAPCGRPTSRQWPPPRSTRSSAGPPRSSSCAAPPPRRQRSRATPSQRATRSSSFYASANRDEDVFEDPQRFDVLRHPNPHVGFGAPGPHFCLGAHLARREITVMYRELFRHLPDIRATAEPDRLRSNFINGIKHLPCRVSDERHTVTDGPRGQPTGPDQDDPGRGRRVPSRAAPGHVVLDQPRPLHSRRGHVVRVPRRNARLRDQGQVAEGPEPPARPAT